MQCERKTSYTTKAAQKQKGLPGLSASQLSGGGGICAGSVYRCVPAFLYNGGYRRIYGTGELPDRIWKWTFPAGGI